MLLLAVFVVLLEHLLEDYGRHCVHGALDVADRVALFDCFYHVRDEFDFVEFAFEVRGQVGAAAEVCGCRC